MTKLTSFFNVVGWSGIQTAIRLALGLISVKVTAVAFGPEGIGLIAQIGTFVTLLGGLLANGAATAVVQRFYRLQTQVCGLNSLVRQCGWIVLISCCAILPFAIFANFFAQHLLGSQSNQFVFLAGVLVVPLFVAGALLQSWVNAYELTRVLYVGQIGSGVIAFVALYSAASYGSLHWSLVAVAFAYAIPALWFGFYWMLRYRQYSWTALIDRIRPTRASLDGIAHIFKYYPTAIVHSVAMPLVLLFIRWLLVTKDGESAMGVWQAAWRLSELYTGMITMAAAVYFAPKLSQALNDPQRYWKTVSYLFIGVTGTVAVCACVLYGLRAWLIPLLFSQQFAKTVDLMPLQLLSDLPRTLHWCIGLVLTSQLARREYIALEIVAVAILAISLMGLQDITQQAVGWAFLAAFGFSSSLGAFFIFKRKPRRLSI